MLEDIIENIKTNSTWIKTIYSHLKIQLNKITKYKSSILPPPRENQRLHFDEYTSNSNPSLYSYMYVGELFF